MDERESVRQAREDAARQKRQRRYIGEFYGHRLWCPPDAFDEEDLAFLTEPYGDADRLRASFADYEVVMGTRPLSAPKCSTGRSSSARWY